MAMRKKFIFSALFCLVASGLAFGQAPGGPGGPGGDGHGWGRPPMERTFHDGQFGRWWENPKIAQAIGLTDDEKKKMDDIYQQHKLKLIDLHANLEKAEVQMGPMIEADQPDETGFVGAPVAERRRSGQRCRLGQSGNRGKRSDRTRKQHCDTQRRHRLSNEARSPRAGNLSRCRRGSLHVWRLFRDVEA